MTGTMTAPPKTEADSSATQPLRVPLTARLGALWHRAIALKPTSRPTPPPTLAPRDARWAAGAAITAVSVLLLAFVAQAMVFSALQHQRDLVLGYDQVRASLAKGETPVGQLDVNGDLVAPGTPVALLQIPQLGVSEVVREGTTAAVLRSGPGHRRDTVMPGQAGTAVIMGRQTSYGGPFANLGRLTPGSSIVVTTGQGTASFTVFSLRRAGDPLPADPGTGEGRLELITADGPPLFPSGVLYIDAVQVSPVQPASARVMTYPALPTAERAMGSDASAWPMAIASVIALIMLIGATGWLWRRWGWRWAWLIGAPVLLAAGVVTSTLIVDALPNLL
jgi:hypothetical protein